MKIKTPELSGAALDWAVAVAEGDESVNINEHSFVPDCEQWSIVRKHLPKYSTNWKQGGPILEENDISIECFAYPYDATRGPDRYMAWRCGERHCLGPSPLVAAMRCYCQSKLGYEVEVPEELTRKEQG